MSKKVIEFGLTESEIDKAISELNSYKNDILDKTNKLREKVAKRLQEESQSGFSGAIVQDIVEKSGGPRYGSVDVSVKNEGNISLVIANGEDAVWIEFGAGVFHNGQAGSSPHPQGQELGFTIGSYGSGKGKRKAWGFYEGGQLVITRGTPAIMPMSKAMTTVINELPSIVKEVFG